MGSRGTEHIVVKGSSAKAAEAEEKRLEAEAEAEVGKLQEEGFSMGVKV